MPHRSFASAKGQNGLGLLWSCTLAVVEAEPEPDDAESEERADGIDEGIVRGGLAAGDESLVDFVERGIAESDEQRGQSPGPAPANARATNPAVEQQAEDKVLGEVGGLANVMVNELELRGGQVRFEPAQDGPEKPRGVIGGESICGHDEDDRGPEQSGPPGA